MIKFIQLVLLGGIVFGVIYFMEEINRGNINPQTMIQQKTQEFTSAIQEDMDDTYDNISENFDEDINKMSDNAQQIVQQIMK
jgi:protein-tyrosine-phosphatase